MKILKNYTLIKNDMFHISERLKRINKNYYILFNQKKLRFEVHSSEQLNNSYCFLVPNNKLDKRVLDYVFYSNINNFDSIISKIDNDNAKIINNNRLDKLDSTSQISKEIFDYESGCTRIYNPNTAYKNKWL